MVTSDFLLLLTILILFSPLISIDSVSCNDTPNNRSTNNSSSTNSSSDTSTVQSTTSSSIPRLPTTSISPPKLGSSDYERIFKESGLIPDVIKKAPKNILSVDYDSGATACLGNLLSSIQTRTEPRFNWTSVPKTLYTVVMVDPDAPLALIPVLGEVLHYLSVNVPSADRFYEGDVVRAYAPPAPPLTGGAHRYLFLIYEQSERISVGFQIPFRFYMQEFAERYKLGDPYYHQPVYGNFFRVINSLTRRSTSCELIKA